MNNGTRRVLHLLQNWSLTIRYSFITYLELSFLRGGEGVLLVSVFYPHPSVILQMRCNLSRNLFLYISTLIYSGKNSSLYTLPITFIYLLKGSPGIARVEEITYISSKLTINFYLVVHLSTIYVEIVSSY